MLCVKAFSLKSVNVENLSVVCDGWLTTIICQASQLDGEQGEDGVVRLGPTHDEVSEDVVQDQVEDKRSDQS